MEKLIAVGSQFFKITSGNFDAESAYLPSALWIIERDDLQSLDIPKTWFRGVYSDGQEYFTTPIGKVLVLSDIVAPVVTVNGFSTLSAEDIIDFWRWNEFNGGKIPGFVQSVLEYTKEYKDTYARMKEMSVSSKESILKPLNDIGTEEAKELSRAIANFDTAYSYSDDSSVYRIWSTKQKEINSRLAEIGLPNVLEAYIGNSLQGESTGLWLSLQKWVKSKWMQLHNTDKTLVVPECWYLETVDNNFRLAYGLNNRTVSKLIVGYDKYTGIVTTLAGTRYLLDARSHDSSKQYNTGTSLFETGFSAVISDLYK